MLLNPYINFNGNCREAVDFYADVFKTEKPVIMTYGDAHNGELREDVKDLVMHTYLNIHGLTIMFSDFSPEMDFVMGNNVSLTIVSKDMDEIRYLYERFKEGGRIDMELQETFWSKLYGSVIDKFGVIWQFSHEV